MRAPCACSCLLPRSGPLLGGAAFPVSLPHDTIVSALTDKTGAATRRWSRDYELAAEWILLPAAYDHLRRDFWPKMVTRFG
jgi:hypothetical protein